MPAPRSRAASPETTFPALPSQLRRRVIPGRPAPDACFLELRLPRPTTLARLPLGPVAGVRRFVAAHRYESFWMKPAVGAELRAVPGETQLLLCALAGGRHLLVVPLAAGPFRCSLRGTRTGLELVAETGDPALPARESLAAYLAVGRDPQRLVAEGARAVARALGARLRTEKPLPDFADDFGWCTWDAFYHEVTPAGVRAGLSAFRRGGVSPRFLILDDGWQHTSRSETGEDRLASFGTDARKFPRGLAPLVAETKRDFGIRRFLVWHAIVGYWGGVDSKGLPGYGVLDAHRNYGPDLLAHLPNANHEPWGQRCGLVPPRHAERFFDDYHAALAAAGVDGVKIDNQAVLEALATGQGGRVALTRAYRRAIEASARRHFEGRLINCMSNGNETHVLAADSTLMRTSTDFWPKRPESHGLHLHTNALVNLWFGEFVHGDWDMFHSRHPRAAFHAAARAVSGSPVYVSDKPGHHDFSLLKKLVLPDGVVPRCEAPGRISTDCLYEELTAPSARVPLKIHNRAGEAALVGVFDCRHDPAGGALQPLATRVSAADVPGLGAAAHALFAHRADKITPPARAAKLEVKLAPQGWELVTLVPADRGVAVFGLADMLATAATVSGRGWIAPGRYRFTLRAAGRVLAWTKSAPRAVSDATGKALRFTWREGRLEIPLRRAAGPLVVELAFGRD
jgi:raffinose synthase